MNYFQIGNKQFQGQEQKESIESFYTKKTEMAIAKKITPAVMNAFLPF
jgi:hypothetical protein